jgi:DNA-binding NarL/FixJ family response regulator
MPKARILVVADKGRIAEELRAGLSDFGYEVIVAAPMNVWDATEIKRANPDLILVGFDWAGDLSSMPAANAMGERLGIPVVLSASRPRQGGLDKAKIPKPFGYLIKPLQPESLASVIESALLTAQQEPATESDSGVKIGKSGHRGADKDFESSSSLLEQRVKERTTEFEASNAELKRYAEGLEKTNEALRVIVQGIEEQKRETEKKLTQNINLTVQPIMEQLKSLDLPKTVQFLVKSLDFNLNNILSSFGLNIIREGRLLTPRELRICEMIRSGLSSKQIAKVIGISPQTVLVHRKNIRKKLALGRSGQNLASFLKANL